MKTIASITTTICTVKGAENHRISTEPPLDEIISEAKRTLGGENIDRCLIYAPDAIGEALHRDQRDQFVSVERLAPTSILLRSMVSPPRPLSASPRCSPAPYLRPTASDNTKNPS